MNMIEKQIKLQRELVEVQTSALKQLVELAQDGSSKYVALNRDFAQRLPSFGDLGAWASLQREYGETLWGGYQEYLKAQGEILKGAFSQSNDLVRGAFSTAEPAATTSKAKKAA
ncbi:MAG: phasin family protein [Pseudomonadota bacterium]